MKSNLFIALFFLLVHYSFAQVAKEIVLNTSSEITSTNGIMLSEELYIGPSANLKVEGNWDIYSEKVYIHPDAQIYGEGTVYFRDRLGNPLMSLASTTTILDAGGVVFDVDVVIENQENVILQQIPTPATSPWTSAEGVGEDDFVIGKSLRFSSTIETINNSYTISNNHLIINDANLRFLNNATIDGYSHERYVITNSSGRVISENTNSFIYPIGFKESTNDQDYSPAQIENGEGATFSVGVFDYANTTACFIQEPEAGVSLTWDINTLLGNPTNTSITLQHSSMLSGSLYTSSTSQLITRCIGTAPNTEGGQMSTTEWDYGFVHCDLDDNSNLLTTATTSPSGRLLTRTSVGDFDQYNYFTKAFCSRNVLPIELVSFMVFADECDVSIEWRTASETNNSHFVIERSSNGIDYEDIAHVEGAGTSTEPIDYSHIDQPGFGNYYYRLRQVDFDGTSTTSRVRYVSVENCGAFNPILYPNPASGTVNVDFVAQSDGLASFAIYSMNGQLMTVYEKNVSKGEEVTAVLNIGGLANANYIVRLQNGTYVEQLRLLVAQ